MADELMPVDELARKARAGSVSAFEDLVRIYEQRVFSFVCMLCRSREDAMEITQDTFVAAFRAIAQFDPRQHFCAWLFTIARRKVIDHVRRMPVQTAQQIPETWDFNTPADVLARREEAAELWRAARRVLPELHFQALWLRYAEDMDIGQISQVLGRTQTHVKVLLFRARLRLAATLASKDMRGISPAACVNSDALG